MMSEGFAAFALRARESGITDPALVSAFEKAGRAHFVDAAHRDQVWSPRCFPIACGETLESPDFQIALLSKLDLEPGQRVLEIGAGSGFCTAVLAAQADKLLSIERYRTLAASAGEQIKRLGLDNHVIIRHGSAFEALEREEGPFDRIVIWASFDQLPGHLAGWLSGGGVAVVAIGAADELQTVARLEKIGSRFERTDFAQARMQPLAEQKAQYL
ncbi:rRNA adenine N-6-methyltransferase family protein [Notoacmeibacter sp. MSK16QG-6]|uniref:rRNA adenine N-6-methyltransferase family protein n=1 Tax=Notoacmeibacter sp. MSK16QG-6 TaxID=2957982 RepID=UPI00209E1D3A|nr:rRNA adenine N-6-methyltransferase family protein [Notoacmeibacter sp. MSK16QG-6]MCP1199385.1 class I SAM-dependent methyltransferase [Notoacmeibacter sp. MSK16QG-6]